MSAKRSDTPNPAFRLVTHTFLSFGNRKWYKIKVGSGGSIPLWDKNVTLNWRFDKSFGSLSKDPKAKDRIRKLLQEAILAWGEACPVIFREVEGEWDFEITMQEDKCSASGCSPAHGFAPGPGQHMLYIAATLFEQSYQEQVETMEHELGHIFGLQHSFASFSETEIFGTGDDAFSIMKYGSKSTLTETDINDVKNLYEQVWSGKLTEIKGTPIETFRSHHMLLPLPAGPGNS